MRRSLLVILDLDETLVHVPDHPLDRRADFDVLGHDGYRRPHLAAFLDGLRGRHDVAIWTTAQRDYADAIVSAIVPWRSELAFVWTAEQCSPHVDAQTGHRGAIKDIEAVRSEGYDLSRTVMIDDAPERHPCSSANLVPIPPFLGDPRDTELGRLATFIEALARQPDVRAVEKRLREETSRTMY